jgi:hypothetical protein
MSSDLKYIFKMSPVDFKSILSPLVSKDLSEPDSSVWVVYAAVIIETVSSPKNISDLWKYVVSQERDEDKQLKIARRIREGLLKTSPLAGFPKVQTMK